MNELMCVDDLKEHQVKGKNALVRVSFDAFDKEGNIQDSLRIEASEGTIRTLKKLGAKRIILMCYAGRPEGYDASLSMRPAANFLYGLFRERMHFLPSAGKDGKLMAYKDYIQHVKQYMEKDMEDGEAVLLENLRFWPEENKGDEEFAKYIASLGEIYVQDGFAQAHRLGNATVGAITKYVKTRVMGVQFKKEVTYLKAVSENLLKEGRKPFIFIIAGKKVETKPGIVSKITVASKLMDNMKRGDKIMIGGAIAYPFIIAKEFTGKAPSIRDMRNAIGESFIEENQVYDHMKMAEEIFSKASKNGIEVMLPVDHVVKCRDGIKTVAHIEQGMMAADIGEKTVNEWKNNLSDAGTIILSGPVGWYENPLFSSGSLEITKAMAKATSGGTVTVAAGGDTSSMVRKFGYERNFSLLSIGGGATLEFLMHGKLPVMDVLDTKEMIKV
ncbi:MAG: phosphoglycerate kinase [Candidatus Aenigmarchaeota archaeon]|nr:phosphoglycerate kinase [Candidatus Aenigmarchaeota archaeon]